jgi:hypothetical protein
MGIVFASNLAAFFVLGPSFGDGEACLPLRLHMHGVLYAGVSLQDTQLYKTDVCLGFILQFLAFFQTGFLVHIGIKR